MDRDSAEMQSQSIVFVHAVDKKESEASDKMTALMDNIFDDHDKEIHSLNNNAQGKISKVYGEAISVFNDRVCSKCIFGEHRQTLGIGIEKFSCEKNVSQWGKITRNNNGDFGCNLWEKNNGT